MDRARLEGLALRPSDGWIGSGSSENPRPESREGVDGKDFFFCQTGLRRSPSRSRPSPRALRLSSCQSNPRSSCRHRGSCRRGPSRFRAGRIHLPAVGPRLLLSIAHMPQTVRAGIWFARRMAVVTIECRQHSPVRPSESGCRPRARRPSCRKALRRGSSCALVVLARWQGALQNRGGLDPRLLPDGRGTSRARGAGAHEPIAGPGSAIDPVTPRSLAIRGSRRPEACAPRRRPGRRRLPGRRDDRAIAQGPSGRQENRDTRRWGILGRTLPEFDGRHAVGHNLPGHASRRREGREGGRARGESTGSSRTRNSTR